MIKINRLELENIKKIKAVTLMPSENGLTVIGGKNGQGKTSVLDAIAWALGGAKFAPSEPHRDGSVLPPALKLTLSNGLIVERNGKNSTLKVTDVNGNKGGQQLLDEFIEELALNLPKFMQANDKEKAQTLLKIIGVGPELARLEAEENRMYSERHSIGVIADQKKKFVAEMPYYEGVPKNVITASELIQKQQEILYRNGENQRKRQKVQEYAAKLEEIRKRIEDTKEKLYQLNEEYSATEENYRIAMSSAEQLIDESTAEIERSLSDIDSLNVKIRANLDREKASIEADAYKAQYDRLSDDIEAVRDEKRKLLESANLPLPGLSVEQGELTYNGNKWDCMSASEQLKVSVAIVKALKPECGFVLMDKLEQMDLDTLKDFCGWLEENNLQVIATRVSTGDECSVIIEDGSVYEQQEEKKWKEGQF